VAEKTAPKTTTKSPAKVFDISKPGKQPASASARPLIVTNRPIMQDPMVAAAGTDEKTTASSKISPSFTKIKLEPLSLNPDDAEAANTSEKDTTSDKKQEESAVVDVPKDPKEEFKFDAPKEESPVVDEKSAKGSGDEKSTGTTEVTSTDAKPDADKKDASDSSPASQGAPADDKAATEESKATDTPADSGAAPEAPPSEINPDAAEAAKLEAEAKKQAELDKLVEEKTYFLPINSVERRRSKLVSLLGILLILALGALLLDLMLDAGFVKLGGLQAVTHFF
jgi:hypothetical protein